MPRFASNLSFNPLEPLKPMSNASSNSLNKSDLNDGKILAPQASRPDIIAAVPEVQFDWNSSGLVNPLDGEFNAINSFVFSWHFFLFPYVHSFVP